MTTLETLRASAGPGLDVDPWHRVEVPGIQFFVIGNERIHRAVAVVDGDVAAPLEGKPALRLALDRSAAPPIDAARLALLFLDDGGEPYVDAAARTSLPSTLAARLAAPRVDGGVLHFWRVTAADDDAIRYALDLGTLELQRQSGAAIDAAAGDAVARADAMLASGSASGYDTAIDALVAACRDARAAPLVVRTLTSHPQAKARAYAALRASACHHERTVPALIDALGDASAEVRKSAADSLGALRAASARSALAKAGADPDPNVRGAAARALAKLP